MDDLSHALISSSQRRSEEMLDNTKMDVHEARYLVDIFEQEKEVRKGRFVGPVLGVTEKQRAAKQLAYRTLHMDIKRRTAPGVVYIIRRQDLVKIGFSQNLPARVKCIEMHCGERVRVLAFIRGDKADEFRLHQLFAKHRAIGEWFHVRDELVPFCRQPMRSLRIALK